MSKKKPALKCTAHFVHKVVPSAAWIQFYGADPAPELVNELLAAGWVRPKFGVPPPTSLEHRSNDSENLVLEQPSGSGLFGAPTRKEAKSRIDAACRLFHRYGVSYGSHKQTLEEAL